MRRFRRLRPAPGGQTLVETALVLPIFLLVVCGIIVLGIGLFYQQEITTVARETARGHPQRQLGLPGRRLAASRSECRPAGSRGVGL